MAIGEQQASRAQRQHDDGRWDLAPALNSSGFFVGVQPGLFSCRVCQFAPYVITLVDDEHDSIRSRQSACNSSAEHQRDGVAVGADQAEASFGSGILGDHDSGTAGEQRR